MVTPIEPANANDSPSEGVDAAVSLLTAVADPVRWTVLQRLAESQSCVCNLQEHIPIASNLLSYHLKVLRDAGLVTTSRRGRWIDYSLAPDTLDRLRAALPGGTPLRRSKIGAPT
jgi:ArsR family transcriptional regulator